MSRYEAQTRAARFAREADRNPETQGWASRINRTCLDMSDPENCIGAQIWGHFNQIPKRFRKQAIGLGLIIEEAERIHDLSFLHPAVRHLAQEELQGYQQKYRELTFAFNKEIDKRLPKPALAVHYAPAFISA